MTRPTGVTNYTPLPHGTRYQPIKIGQVKKQKKYVGRILVLPMRGVNNIKT